MNYALVNGIILDGSEKMKPVCDKTVLVEGKIIKAIVDKSEPLPDGYKEVDLKGQLLLQFIQQHC